MVFVAVLGAEPEQAPDTEKETEHEAPQHTGSSTASDADPRIVSTVRVFDRRAYLNGALVRAGGIGEVSTRSEHRGRGLASRLLRAAERTMCDTGMTFGLLHTDSHGFYARLGWTALSTGTVAQPLTAMLRDLRADAAHASYGALRPHSIRRYCPRQLAAHSQTERREGSIWAGIQQVYEDYNRSRFSGVFSRQCSSHYWDRWVAGEWDELAVMLDAASPSEADPVVVAYIVFKWKREVNDSSTKQEEEEEWRRTVTIREFGVAQQQQPVAAVNESEAFCKMVEYIADTSSESESESEETWVKCPIALFETFCSSATDTDAPREVELHKGCMVLIPNTTTTTTTTATLTTTPTTTLTTTPTTTLFGDLPFHFWAADNF
eukprot:TRINITY_DN6350_c1_g1_i3.p1 TRINITY_DN6350_c1_g1~~TRINITY_DN6350_c1_g1_i3.p1  ORF type:complete len:378 (+),score=72.89 TRINITY_DN6350_c1_g1_i3:279-1412(+)